MSDDKKVQSTPEEQPEKPEKRKTVRHMLTGGGVIGAAAVGGKWHKPNVDSVLLPAHARATGGGGDPGEGNTPPPTVPPSVQPPTPEPTPSPSSLSTPGPTPEPSSASTMPP